jgi:GNAT superfamily N-acetyltransferase
MQITQATLLDARCVAAVLRAAAARMRVIGREIWQPHEIDDEDIADHVAAGLYHIARRQGLPVGVFRFQLEDPEIWPDIAPGSSSYIHRVAVHPSARGDGTSVLLLERARLLTQRHGRRFLRLECAHDREKLRSFYEAFGFQHHSDRQVGPWHLARYELVVEGELRCL